MNSLSEKFCATLRKLCPDGRIPADISVEHVCSMLRDVDESARIDMKTQLLDELLSGKTVATFVVELRQNIDAMRERVDSGRPTRAA